jgi:hypothetical protein
VGDRTHGIEGVRLIFSDGVCLRDGRNIVTKEREEVFRLLMISSRLPVCLIGFHCRFAKNPLRGWNCFFICTSFVRYEHSPFPSEHAADYRSNRITLIKSPVTPIAVTSPPAPAPCMIRGFDPYRLV